MRGPQAQGNWAILATFFLAACLEVFPVPEILEPGRPAWFYLVLMYWVYALPHRVGVVAAFFAGLYLDVLTGVVLGQQAMVMATLAYFIQVSRTRLRVFPPIQQSLVVMVLVLFASLLSFLIQDSVGRITLSIYWLLLTALVSGLLWRPVYLLLRWVHRRVPVR